MSILRSPHPLVAIFAIALGALTPASARATQAEGDAVRLSTSGQRSVKWNWTPPGRSDRYGHAEALINAPLTAVLQQVENFSQYKEFAPKRFTQSRVVGHDGGTDVYMEFSVLHGLVKLWNVSKFAAPRAVSPGLQIVEGKFLRGNVKDSNVVWTLEQVDENFTVLKCDILIKPDLPAAAVQSAIDEELRDAAQQAVDGVQRRAQGHDHAIAWAPKKG